MANNGMHFENVAGRTVGRVPANLCRVFCHLQDYGYAIGHITARYVAEIGPSVNLPTQTRFRRNANGGLDHAGCGAELQCSYHLSIQRRHLRAVMGIFEVNLLRPDLERFSVLS